jgi:hypothetical protein
MRVLIGIAACVCLLGFASPSDAATIASPAIFGAHTQDIARCVVYNAGSTAQTVTIRLLDESGGVISTTTQSLAPGQFLSRASFISFGVAYACSVTAGTTSTLRAAFVIEEQVFNSSPRPIRSAPLR